MTQYRLTRDDCFGFVRPAVDAHVLGINSLGQLLAECGFRSVTADAATCSAFGNPEDPASAWRIVRWIQDHGITVLGFSYRLDPNDGAALFAALLALLKRLRLLADQGGPLRGLYFAGLPLACEIVRERHPEVTAVFCGDETAAETLSRLGICPMLLPSSVAGGIAYDQDRLAFGRDLIRTGNYLAVTPVAPGGYPEFGTRHDTLPARVHHHVQHNLPPVMRAHVGPYGPDRIEAVQRFLQWTQTLAHSGFLDVLSIGTSQLSQSSFGEEWADLPNGGGVPLNTKEEFATVWKAARPMLVRTYAGTRNVPALARMYEETIHIAWHALSLWWFCLIDGRGPHTVYDNLREHVETLRYVAATQKPFEPNIPHHFAFRGADDVTYIVSAVLAARLAKRLGVRYLVLQNMLNTPKYTWGVQDLAKSRALLHLVRELQDSRFLVFLQPRGGLDYFSPDAEKAKAQLAAVTALMDDIEPHCATSPQIIHVVSYSEALHLADPAVVNESIQITRHALEAYRNLRRRGLIDDMSQNRETAIRTVSLLSDARTVLQAIETKVPDPYSAEGLYRIFAEGYLPVPYLWECKDEFRKALAWQTRMVHGGVKVVDRNGNPMTAADRMHRVENSQDTESCIIEERSV
jgi:hypothetical protein